jgi:uncharacterized protein YwqG
MFEDETAMKKRKTLVEVLHEVGLSHRIDDLLKLSKPAILVETIKARKEAKIPVGASKYGGSPDVPDGFEWPEYDGKPLTFIVQIRLPDIAPYDTEKLLPETGMLYFFYEADKKPHGYYPEEKGSNRVLYVEDELLPLHRYQHPVIKSKWGDIEGLPSHTLTFSSDLSLPPNEKIEELGVFAQNELDMLPDFIFGGYPFPSQLLGYPNELAGDHRDDCQLAFNGMDATPRSFYEIYESLGLTPPSPFGEKKGASVPYKEPPEIIEMKKRRDEILTAGVEDWILLLQLATGPLFNEETLWGEDEPPILYYYIRKSDLSVRDFSKTWTIIPSI